MRPVLYVRPFVFMLENGFLSLWIIRQNKGHETYSMALARGDRNVEWLREQQRILNDDELIVIVCHGATMGITVRKLFQVSGDLPGGREFGFGDIPNTAVHCINLPKPPTPGAKPDVFMGAPGKANMEFFSSTAHLGPNRIIEHLALRSGTSLVEPASEWLQTRWGRKQPPRVAAKL